VRLWPIIDAALAVVVDQLCVCVHFQIAVSDEICISFCALLHIQIFKNVLDMHVIPSFTGNDALKKLGLITKKPFSSKKQNIAIQSIYALRLTDLCC
jgi:hypothetical protein